MTLQQKRAEFAKLRHIAEHECTRKEWMDAVKKLLPENPTPDDWLNAA